MLAANIIELAENVQSNFSANSIILAANFESKGIGSWLKMFYQNSTLNAIQPQQPQKTKLRIFFKK